MPPQDQPLGPSAAPPPANTSAVDLSAQIPPSYAPPLAGSAPVAAPGTMSPPPSAPSTSTVLQDALNAQLTPPATPIAHAPTPASPSAATPTPGSALDAHLEADEPDPLAGFTDPALRAATTEAHGGDEPLMPQPTSLLAPGGGSGSLPVAPVSAPAVTSITPPPPVDTNPALTNPVVAPMPTADVQPLPPTPAAAESYAATQGVAAAPLASSLPSAPEPMPPNPLEQDPVAAPPAPGPTPTPVEPDLPPVPVSTPPPSDDQPLGIDLVTGVPVDRLPKLQPQSAPVETGAQPLQNMLEDPQLASLDSLDPYSDPLLMASEGATAGEESGGNSILFSVAVGAAVLVFGIIVLALVLGKKTTTVVNTDDLSGGATQSSIKPTISVPDGYVAIAKECYEFGIPTDNTVSTSDTSCSIDASFGAQEVSTIAVVPSIESSDNLDSAVDAAKQTAGISASSITGTRDIKLGEEDAKEIVYNGGTKEKPDTKTLIVVLAKDDKHKQGEDVITAYAITMSSGDTFTQDAVKTLEASWKWR